MTTPSTKVTIPAVSSTQAAETNSETMDELELGTSSSQTNVPSSNIFIGSSSSAMEVSTLSSKAKTSLLLSEEASGQAGASCDVEEEPEAPPSTFMTRSLPPGKFIIRREKKGESDSDDSAEGESSDDTLALAAKVRDDQGYHQVEVTFGGEADLHTHRKNCAKNPGHINFIPRSEFNMSHIPEQYRSQSVMELIESQADVTVRLSVKGISNRRPKFFSDESERPFPFFNFRGNKNVNTLGSGWVQRVSTFSAVDGKPCECEACKTLSDPPKEWGEVAIGTAAHVVYDDIESRNTTCFFFYDKGGDDVNELPKLCGFETEFVDVAGDRCEMVHKTHDMSLLKDLGELWERYDEAHSTVYDETHRGLYNRKDGSKPTKSEPKLTVITGHPHGCNKQISIGSGQKGMKELVAFWWKDSTFILRQPAQAQVVPCFYHGWRNSQLEPPTQFEHHNSGT